jgi:hypothetical protein
MSRQPESKAVEHSCRVYRRLLFAYPKAHREEYGAAMLQLFRDQCRDAWAAKFARGLIGFWLRAMADLLKTSVLEHFSKLNRNSFMLTLFRPTIKPLPTFFGIVAVVFLAIFSVSTLITFLYPETFAGTATILTSPLIANAPDSESARTEPLVISSSAVLEKTVQAMNLRYVWGKKYNNGEPLNASDALNLLKSRLEVSVVTGHDAYGQAPSETPIRIRTFSDNAEEAARLANGVAEAYRDYRRERDLHAGGSPDVRRVTILDPAVPVFRPIRPNKPLNMVVGALAGILIGSIIASIVLGIVAAIRKSWNAARIPKNA